MQHEVTLTPENQFKALLEEYKAANTYTNHVDELNWQVGSILIGGSIAAVALSFNLANSQFKLAPAFVSLAGLVAVMCWFFYVRRGRAMTRITIARMRMIEYRLGLEFHRNLYDADNSPFHRITFPFPTGPETIGMPTPTAWESMKLLAAGIMLVFMSVIVYVVLSVLFLK
jgi:hypothetical protein